MSGDQGARSGPPPGLSPHVVGKPPKPLASTEKLARMVVEALDEDPPRIKRARWFAEELCRRAVMRQERAPKARRKVAS